MMDALNRELLCLLRQWCFSRGSPVKLSFQTVLSWAETVDTQRRSKILMTSQCSTLEG